MKEQTLVKLEIVQELPASSKEILITQSPIQLRNKTSMEQCFSKHLVLTCLTALTTLAK